MNHVTECVSVRTEDKDEPDSRFPEFNRTYRYWYCKHGVVIANQFIKSYLRQGND